MSNARQNHIIARLIVGAMSIDGSLDRAERDKVAQSLERIGMGELVASVGLVFDEDMSDFNMFKECKELTVSLGADAREVAPLVFRVISDVVANDRYVSAQEAAYLSALAKRLELPADLARATLKQVMAERRGRLEIAGNSVDQAINPYLKELLSFSGAEKLVGQEPTDEHIEEMITDARDALAEGERVSSDELSRALAILGLEPSATLTDAKEVWRETIETLDLPRMANLGETFVSAALNRITRVNEAYKAAISYHKQKE